MTKAKHGTCNAYPRVWAAMYGCTGRGKRQRVPGELGAVFACETCAAMKRITHCYQTAKLQRFWSDVEQQAGVSDYRWQRTGRDRRTRRPYLVIDGERRFMASILERWPSFAPIE